MHGYTFSFHDFDFRDLDLDFERGGDTWSWVQARAIGPGLDPAQENRIGAYVSPTGQVRLHDRLGWTVISDLKAMGTLPGTDIAENLIHDWIIAARAEWIVVVQHKLHPDLAREIVAEIRQEADPPRIKAPGAWRGLALYTSECRSAETDRLVADLFVGEGDAT